MSISPGTAAALATAFLLLLGLALAAFARRRRRVGAALGDSHLLRELLGFDLRQLPKTRLLLIIAAGAALAGAMLDPGLSAQPTTRRGPVVLLLDASGSMLVEEDGLRRLDLQREVARELVRQIQDVPIGIVAFSGRAFTLTPPTRDRAAIQMYLESVDPTIVTQSGSALAAAMRQGLALLTAESGARGTIVLLSDGDETDDRAAVMAAADLARRSGVAVHTIGVGTEAGGPVPAVDLTTGSVQGYLRDDRGELLVSRLGAEMLQEVSARTGGDYAPADEDASVRSMANSLATRTDRRSANGSPRPFGGWLVGLAFALLLLEPFARFEGGRG